jgi:rhamnose transport system permease protein
LKSAVRETFGAFGHELLLAVLLVVLMLVAARVDPSFVKLKVQQGLSFNAWDIALLALPMTLIIITGGIDLSVGSIMALTSVTLGMLYRVAGWPVGMAAGAAILMGILCGMLNGLFVTKVRVHPLIVTLATLSAFRGLAEGLSLGLADVLHVSSVYSGFPAAFTRLGQQPLLAHAMGLFSLPIVGWIFVGAAVIAAVMLAKTPTGRALYAIGHNEAAARYSGIRVDRVKMLIYTLSGLAAALVSVNYSAWRDNAQASVGQGIELDVITAVVLGGTSIFGGRGRIVGTLLGVALIHETREFVGWHYQKNEWVRLVLGILLVTAVAANAMLSRRSTRGRKS